MPVTMQDLDLLETALRRSCGGRNNADIYYGAAADMLSEIKNNNSNPEVIIDLLIESVMNAPNHIDQGGGRFLAKIHCSAIADFLAEFKEKCPL